MAVYQTKSRQIVAIQCISPDNYGPDDTAPTWFIMAYADMIITLPVLSEDGEPDKPGTIANANHGTLSFNVGDWLIYNGPDDIYPCTNEEFLRRYERVPEDLARAYESGDDQLTTFSLGKSSKFSRDQADPDPIGSATQRAADEAKSE